MKYFDTYVSNTIAGSGNQHFFLTEDAETVRRGRVYYKIFAGGTYNYSLLFTNMTDSTFGDGSISRCNRICDEWEIVEASLGICKTSSLREAIEPEYTVAMTFGGQTHKTVMPAEFFTSDPVELCAEKGDYLCMEIAFKGKMIAYHEETLLPTFEWKENAWVSGKHMPFASMVGCDRTVEKKIGFWGDSITQGIGTPNNKYTHWNALAAEAAGEQYSYWNLGLGFAKASDAATNSAWLFKAKQLDGVVLCFGTNDVGNGNSLETIKKDLYTIVTTLQKAGVKVLLQTLPPFDRKEEKQQRWLEVNEYIRKELAPIADAFFDVVPVLIDGPESEGKSKFGGHPNEQGCALWAEKLTPVLKKFIEEI